MTRVAPHDAEYISFGFVSVSVVSAVIASLASLRLPQWFAKAACPAESAKPFQLKHMCRYTGLSLRYIVERAEDIRGSLGSGSFDVHLPQTNGSVEHKVHTLV